MILLSSLQIVLTPESAGVVTESLQTILANVSAEDQTADNVAAVSDIFSDLATLGGEISEEVCF